MNSNSLMNFSIYQHCPPLSYLPFFCVPHTIRLSPSRKTLAKPSRTRSEKGVSSHQSLLFSRSCYSGSGSYESGAHTMQTQRATSFHKMLSFQFPQSRKAVNTEIPATNEIRTLVQNNILY
nr:uncharacterized protein LOC114827034 [Malus domestica]